MTIRPTLLRSRHIATSRNYVLNEMYDTRTYLRFSSKLREQERKVRVKTVCEMEVVTRGRRL